MTIRRSIRSAVGLRLEATGHGLSTACMGAASGTPEKTDKLRASWSDPRRAAAESERWAIEAVWTCRSSAIHHVDWHRAHVDCRH